MAHFMEEEVRDGVIMEAARKIERLFMILLVRMYHDIM